MSKYESLSTLELQSLFFSSCQSGNVELLKELLSSEKVANNIGGICIFGMEGTQYEAVYLAAENLHVNVLKYFINHENLNYKLTDQKIINDCAVLIGNKSTLYLEQFLFASDINLAPEFDKIHSSLFSIASIKVQEDEELLKFLIFKMNVNKKSYFYYLEHYLLPAFPDKYQKVISLFNTRAAAISQRNLLEHLTPKSPRELDVNISTFPIKPLDSSSLSDLCVTKKHKI